MKPKRSPLTDEEKQKATVLHASGKTIYAVARTLGRSPHTLKRFLRSPDVQGEIGVQREVLAGMFDNVTERTLSSVTDEDIRKSSLQQKMVSAGIAVDKAAMLRGELPPTINVNLLLDVADIIRSRERGETTISTTLPALPAPPPEPES